MVKFIKGVLASAALVALGSVGVLAATGGEYAIDEIGAKIQLPEGLVAYTRTSEIDTNMEKILGITEASKERHIEEMVKNDIYLRAFDTNVDYEISLESSECLIETYSTMEDYQILEIVDNGLYGVLDESDIEVIDKSVIPLSERKYAAVEYSQGTAHVYLYATVENSQAYYFFIKVLNGSVTDAHKALVKQIAGGAEFYTKTVVETTAAAVSDSSTTDTQTERQAGDNGFIGQIIDVAKIIFAVVILFVALLSFIKLISKKKVGRKENYGIRRDVNYNNRLKRVMGDDEEKDNGADN